MKARHLLIGLLAALLAAAAAATGSAAPFRPAADGALFQPLTRAEVQQAPTCQLGRLCYPPQMIRDAYDFPNGRGGATGAGQTVIVVVAYGSPFLDADLAAFDAQFGLAAADLTVFPQQVPQSPFGSNAFQSWALETSLDVEWVHALAPDAKIVLAVADTDDPSNVYEVEREATAQYRGAILAQSFGVDENDAATAPDAVAAFDEVYSRLALQGGTALTVSGDAGRAFVSWPATSPFVLAVGGTMGDPYPGGLWDHGRYGGEQAWSEPGLGAGGGGVSSLYDAPPWQLGVTGSGERTIPDVSYNAAINGGVIIAFGGRFGVLGGTSAGAPQWAAILALANELRARDHHGRLGLAAPQLYLLARSRSAYRQDFHDIVDGTNTFAIPGLTIPGASAGPGYDLATGLGTPDVARLIKDLAGRDAQSLRLGDLVTSHGHGDGRLQFAPGR